MGLRNHVHEYFTVYHDGMAIWNESDTSGVDYAYRVVSVGGFINLSILSPFILDSAVERGCVLGCSAYAACLG